MMVELKRKEVFPETVKDELYKIIEPDDLRGDGGSNYVKSSRQLYNYLKLVEQLAAVILQANSDS